MKLEVRFEEGKQLFLEMTFPYRIGRASEMNFVIKSWRVAKHHITFVEREKNIFIEDQGSISGTLLNGNRVHTGGPLKRGDEIIIGPCLMTVVELETKIEGKTHVESLITSGNTHKLNDKQLSDKSDNIPQSVYVEPTSPQEIGEPHRQRELYHRRRLHTALVEALDLRRRNITQMSDAALRTEASYLLDKILSQDTEIEHSFDKQRLKQAVLNEAVGLGPLEELLDNQEITEIMVNRFDEIYIEHKGVLSKTDTVFSSEKAVLGVIDRIVAPIGRRIDESSPMVDARLLDGSRVNAVIPPIALRGSSLTIRKFTQHRPQMEELIKLGSLDQSMASFLELCVKHRMNIVVSGGTGSGKTTLLNILSNCIPEKERIVTIEDAAELRLNHAHLVSLEARPANVEGRGAVVIRDLVRNALRMRPDRIIVGECRGAEAFDMLSAMNTGHEGSLTTLHANSTRDALSRLETMIMMVADMELPLVAIREHIANSVHFIVQQTRLSDGRRVISSIAEVGGMESGVIKMQELFGFDKKSAFVGRGIMPALFEKLRQEGIAIDPELFNTYSPVIHSGVSLTNT